MRVMNNNRKRVLVGSPIHQTPVVLGEFLSSLLRLKQEHILLSFFFVDDNKDCQSSELLHEFAKTHPCVEIFRSEFDDDYTRNDVTHYWNEHLIWKVAEFKNVIIQKAIDGQYDYLFLIDSDLLLHPDTIEHLVSIEKEIVSEIFWTKWQPDASSQPQVWICDEYTQFHKARGEHVSDEEAAARYETFITMLKEPGIYEVGGLGACTLMSHHALISGVNFKPIKNLSFWGEDRHFCIRAAALGFSLFVDTHYPAYHIYRESDLEGAKKFMTETAKQMARPPSVLKSEGKFSKTEFPVIPRPKLTLSMIVKNEANRYLRQALEEHRKYIDEAVIIDDGSTDHTLDLCQDILKGIPIHIVQNKISKFKNEVDLRKQQWEETLKTNPDWILNLDADEVFEKKFTKNVRQLLDQEDNDVFCFRLYDFWDEIHYREDQFWRSHFTYRPFLMRYRENFPFKWKETPQHCGRFPENIFQLPNTLSSLRLKHFGWAKREDRIEKYQRFLMLDPDAKYGWKEQYLSILDENPNLIPWTE